MTNLGTRKQKAIKLIEQNDATVNVINNVINAPNKTYYDVVIENYTLYFVEYEGHVDYLGERDPEGNFR